MGHGVERLLEAAGERFDLGDSRGAEVVLMEAAPLVTDAPFEVKLRWLRALGRVRRTLGSYAEAESVLREALELIEGLGSDLLERARVLNDLGMTLRYAGRLDDAIACYRSALEQMDASGDAASELAASLHHNLGGAEHARGNLDEAERFARWAIELRERLFGPEHPDALLDRAALAPILIAQGRGEDARALLEEVIPRLEGALPAGDEDVAAALGNLAAAELDAGDIARAEELAERALRHRERRLGRDHPDLAPLLNTLALVARRRGDARTAVARYRRALTILERSVHPEHPHIEVLRRNLAVAEREARPGDGG